MTIVFIIVYIHKRRKRQKLIFNNHAIYTGAVICFVKNVLYCTFAIYFMNFKSRNSYLKRTTAVGDGWFNV